MQITVLGASGKVGHLVVEEALRSGYSVRAFVHSHSLFAPSGRLGIVQGDIYEPEDISKTLQGSEAVVSCLGSWGTPGKDVLSTAVRNLRPAMAAHKIRRIVTLTGSGAAAPGESAGRLHRAMLRVPVFGAGRVFQDGEEHMRLLAASGLDWTTIRSPVMNDLGSTSYRLTAKPGSQLATIQREAVARAMLDQLESVEWLGQAPFIHRK